MAGEDGHSEASLQDSPTYSYASSQDELSGLLGRRETMNRFRPAIAVTAVCAVVAAAALLVGTGSVSGSALRHTPRGFQLKAEQELEAGCCTQYSAECLACQRHESVEEYCKRPDEDGIHLCEQVHQAHQHQAHQHQAVGGKKQERDVLLNALNDLMDIPLEQTEAEKRAAEKRAEELRQEEKRKAEEKAKQEKERREEEEREERERRRKERAERKKKMEEHIEKKLRLREKRKEQREQHAQQEGARMQVKWVQKKQDIAEGGAPDYKPVKPVEGGHPSLYCFSLMMPFGYEPGLLYTQRERGVGIFACDESTVFSNLTHLVSGEPSPVPIDLVNGSLAVAYGGRWGTALNTGVFNRLWLEVVRQRKYSRHDWTVKVDPDAVFFPDRLRYMLASVKPMSQVRTHGEEPEQLQCGACQLQGQQSQTCFSHVRKLQKRGHTCSKALELAAREPPTDCGCVCNDFACDLPDEAVYINNCKWGLHGPIEVLSRRAVAMFVAGLPTCVNLLEHPWGEDKFMDQCMIQLGVKRVDEYHLLSETACGEQPAPCGTSDVAFHPFKSIPSYFACWDYASKYGSGPVDPHRGNRTDDLALTPAEEEFLLSDDIDNLKISDADKKLLLRTVKDKKDEKKGTEKKDEGAKAEDK